MSASDALSPRHAYVDGWRGDFRASVSLVHSEGAHAQAWRLVLDAQKWHAGLEGRLPNEAELSSALDTDAPTRSVGLLALAESAKAAVLRLDVDALTRQVALAQHARVGLEEGEGTFWCDAAQTWLMLATGDMAGAAERASALEEAGARHRLSIGVLEAACLRALALSSSDPDEAIVVARRASRMTRTEAFPQWEYLANWILARLRRLTRRSHLSTRILAALARVVPVSWHGFIAWEHWMAGGGRASELDLDLDAGMGDGMVDWARVGASSLGEMLELEAHDDDALDRSIETARAAIGRFAPFASDLESAAGAIDPRASVESIGHAPTQQWCKGAISRPPPELCGLCAHVGAVQPGAAAAWVYAPLSGTARRLAPHGVELVDASAARISPESGRAGRSETLIACLALAGPEGQSLEELFRAVYGFAFVQSTHKNVFNVLMHRTRAKLEGIAEIERDGDQLRLMLHRSLLVPDPRCEQPLEDLVLQLIARRGAGDAKSAAGALEVPLRTVQKALKQLAEEGAVLAKRRGRGVEYRVEDTTFSEPTTAF